MIFSSCLPQLIYQIYWHNVGSYFYYSLKSFKISGDTFFFLILTNCALSLSLVSCYGSCWIDTFIIMKCPSLSLKNHNLFDINIASQGFFQLMPVWYILFHSFIFNLSFSYYIKYISCRQNRIDSFKRIQCDKFCLMVGVFNLLILNAVTNMVGFKHTIILLIVFFLSHYFSLSLFLLTLSPFGLPFQRRIKFYCTQHGIPFVFGKAVHILNQILSKMLFIEFLSFNM